MSLENRSIDISDLNFENPPEGQILTEEILSQAVVAETGETNQIGTLSKIPELENRIWFIPIGMVDPNPGQSREDFEEETMAALESLILADGQTTPIETVPYRNKQGKLRLIIENGERRYRTIKTIGGTYIIAQIKFQKSFRDLFESGAKTNFASKGPNPIEEAKIFKKGIGWRMETEEMDQQQALQDVAATYGMKASHVTKRLALLELPETYQALVRQGMDPTRTLDMWKKAQKAGVNNHAQVAMSLLQVNRTPAGTAGQGTTPTDLSTVSKDTIHEALRRAAEQTGNGESTVRVEELRAAETLSLFVSSVGTTKQRLRKLLDPETLGHAIKIFSNRQGVPPDEAFLEIDDLLNLARTAQALVVRPGAERGRREGEKNPIAMLREMKIRITQILDEVGTSRGFPPQVVEEGLKDLVSALEQFSNQAVIPALSVPSLKIPEGVLTFKKYTEGKIQKILQKDGIRYKIVEILAEASDNQGQVVSIREIAEKLESQGIKQTPQQILNHIVAMDTILRAQGLRADSHVKFTRNKDTKELTRILCYRLAWLPVKKQ